MSTLTRQVQIESQHWLTRKVIKFGKGMEDFFPSDSLGDRNSVPPALEPRRAQHVTFDYGVAQCECDIAVTRNKKGEITQMRPRDKKPNPIGIFFDRNDAAIGDWVTITKVGSRKFEVRLVKAHGTAV